MRAKYRFLPPVLLRNIKPIAFIGPDGPVIARCCSKGAPKTQGEESVLDYTDMRFRELPDKVFSKDYLKRLE